MWRDAGVEWVRAMEIYSSVGMVACVFSRRNRRIRFKGYGSDARHTLQFVDGSVGVMLDDVIGGHLADARKANQFIPCGEVWVDGTCLKRIVAIRGEGQFGFFEAIESPFGRKTAPVGYRPNAGSMFCRIQFEVSQFFPISIGVKAGGGLA